MRPAGRDAFEQTVQIGRCKKLERLGLAQPDEPGRWRLAPELADTLRHMGERGDIVRTMQRAITANGRATVVAEQVVYAPTAPNVRPVIGRVLERGLSDELNDRHYLLVEATDGRTHYVELGRGEHVGAIGTGAVVRVDPVEVGVREVDRTVAAVATANIGRYNVDAHLRHDPSATEAFAEAHVRRLEAMRRLTRGAEREADGTWIIAPDHLDRAAAYEGARAKDQPVTVTTLSPQPIEKLIGADAATWLDRELVAAKPEPLRNAGFGAEVGEAHSRRRQWLIAQGFAEEVAGGTTYRAGMVDELRRREVVRVGAQLSRELGMPFAEAEAGEQISGTYRRPVDLVSGRFAVVERARDFTLVPWRPALEQQIGKSVSGVVRGDGVSWTMERGWAGPSIS